MYGACHDKAKIYETEDRTFINDNAYKQTDFQTSVQRVNRMAGNVESVTEHFKGNTQYLHFCTVVNKAVIR